jgi:hypothetical protein
MDMEPAKKLHFGSQLVAVFALVLVSTSCNISALAITYNVPPDQVPTSLSNGDVLNVTTSATQLAYIGEAEEGSVVNLLPGGAIYGVASRGIVNVFPGAAGMGSGSVSGGEFNVWGGSLGIPSIGLGARLTLDGGSIRALSSRESHVDFLSGVLDSAYLRNSVANIYATTGEGIFMVENSTLNFFGGSLTPSTGASIDGAGVFHFYMSSATLDGAPIPGLLPGTTVIIPHRSVRLEGHMKDMSLIDMFIVGDHSVPAKFVISDDSTLSVTLVPEPVGTAIFAIALAYTIRRPRAVL